MRDQGCMLRAYRREIIKLIVRKRRKHAFITALAQYFANNPAEIEVATKKGTLVSLIITSIKLIRYNFDL